MNVKGLDLGYNVYPLPCTPVGKTTKIEASDSKPWDRVLSYSPAQEEEAVREVEGARGSEKTTDGHTLAEANDHTGKLVLAELPYHSLEDLVLGVAQDGVLLGNAHVRLLRELAERLNAALAVVL